MALIPAPWPVLHTPRGVEAVVDAHGNDRIVDGPAVIRFVMALFQPGSRGSSREIFSGDYLQRDDTTLLMVIPAKDLEFYAGGDQVVVGGSVVGGEYVDGVGYRLEGQPASDLNGPWPHLYRAFGGMVEIRRVG